MKPILRNIMLLLLLLSFFGCGNLQMVKKAPDTLKLNDFFELLHEPKIVSATGFNFFKPQTDISNWYISKYDLRDYLFITYKINKSKTHTTFFKILDNESETIITSRSSFYSMITNEILTIKDTNSFKYIELKIQLTNRQYLWAINYQSKLLQKKNGTNYNIINYGFICYQPSLNSYVHAVYSDRYLQNETIKFSSEEASSFLNNVYLK